VTSKQPLLVARTVFRDCQAAYRELCDCTDRETFRRRWFAFIGLLDAVVDISVKYDKNQLSSYREIFDSCLDRSKPIYEHFIHGIRNRTIHQYRSGLWPSNGKEHSNPITHRTPSGDSTAMAASTVSSELSDESAPIPFNIKSGHFAGQNLYDLCDEALAFLDTYITDIERHLRDTP
jgi:hypothetical protein